MVPVIVMILPLVLLIIIIVGLIVVNKRFSRKPLTFQKSKGILIGYISILLMVTVFSFFLPKSEANIIEKEELDEYGAMGLFQKALNGNFSSIDKDNIDESWEIEFTGDSLSLASDYYDEGVLIEKTSELNEKITVYFIKDFDILGVNSVKMDVSEYTPSMDIEVSSDTLRFVSPEEEPSINIAFNDLPFTMKQLTGDGQYGSAGYNATRSRFFYIRVPKELDVEFPEFMYVDYVKN